ncbi:hypothetical protein BOX15_Mlig008103g1, partial [Macrostomum lignano]
RSQRQQPLLFSQISRHRAECPPGEIRDSTRLATVFSQFSRATGDASHCRGVMTLSDSGTEQPQVLQQLPQSQQQQSSRLGFHRLLHSEHQAAVEEQINSTLSLVKIVADFTDSIAQLQCSVGLQLEEILDDFQDKCEQLGSRQGDQSCCGSALDAWFSLLKEMHEEAKSHSLLSGALMKNVHSQLSDLGSHKSAQAGRIFALRSRLDQTVAAADRSCGQRLQEFNELYGSYASDSRNASRLVSSLLSAHNEYVLSLRSANRTKEELYGQHLPGMLQELEEIQLDATNALTGALESHCYLRMSSLDTIRGRYESALTACKSAAPQRDIQSFVRSRLAAAAAATAASSTAASGSAGPSDRSAAPFELATYSPASLGESDFVLKDEIVNDRLTEAQLRTRHQELAKESQELKSFIRQNEEVTESLKIFCQRNLGNHLYDKVYETQEDLSRKRNEIRMASIQLAAVQAQMDMMNFGKKSDEADADDKKDDASMKGLWKRAFNTLRIRDKEKAPKKKKGGKDEDDAADDVDPVYSLLKRAADKGVQKCTGCTPESGGSPLSAGSLQPGGKSGGDLLQAAAASPCQEVPLCRGADCPCLCHNPLQLLVPSITLNDLKPRPKQRKGKSRSSSLAQTPQSPQPAASELTSAASNPDGGSVAWSGRSRMASLRESGGRRQQQLE